MLKWLKKIDLLLLISVMAILLFVVVMLYGFNSGKFDFIKKDYKNRNVLQVEEEKIKRTDYTQVARKTLDWIDKQRNEEGWYILERGCDYEKKTCEMVWDNKEGNKDGLIATWARLSFYEQHKDPKDLKIVKKDIDIFYEKYKDDNLKDSLWICKITYEMAQSKYIEQGQKDKLKELCLNVKYLTPAEVKEYMNNRIGELNKLKIDPRTNWKGYSLVVRGVDSHFAMSTEMVARYQWRKENKDLNLAKEYWHINKDYLDVLSTENKCLLGLSGIDLYGLGDKDKEVLGFVEGIYDKYMKEDDTDKVKRDYQTTMCGFLLKSLYEITEKSKYGMGLEENNIAIIKMSDYFSNVIKIPPNGGLYKATISGSVILDKNVSENGLLVKLLFN